ncbi:flavo protein-like protein [Blyttiomyces helicus]|uniref:Flavo protein-like protein n=1 Tax=Blyttiomyces helicus TaxID=388810 RepID=A0A4P9VZ20_9FUNG|nr:flavo protein-like protein [Blyttiomyces helicus]|eukprot:RKO83046.1 flavo protein-like protein [Blyttiomyces helicus]
MNRPSLLILYGSETGCAQEVAERIAREGRRLLLKPRCMAMDDYDRSRLDQEPLVVFVAATTGQGQEPGNMKKFWKSLLRKSLPPNALSTLTFAVFGLGDSSYPKYNFPSKKLHKRLLQLGASAIVPLGEGDDQHYLG